MILCNFCPRGRTKNISHRSLQERQDAGLVSKLIRAFRLYNPFHNNTMITLNRTKREMQFQYLCPHKPRRNDEACPRRFTARQSRLNLCFCSLTTTPRHSRLRNCNRHLSVFIWSPNLISYYRDPCFSRSQTAVPNSRNERQSPGKSSKLSDQTLCKRRTSELHTCPEITRSGSIANEFQFHKSYLSRIFPVVVFDSINLWASAAWLIGITQWTIGLNWAPLEKNV